MKKRNPLAVFFLSIITLGIYDLYWLVKTKNYLNKNTSKHTPTIWLLFLPVIIALVLLIVGFTFVGVNSAAHQSAYGTPTSSSGNAAIILILEVLAWLIVIPVTFYWFLKFSKAVNEYTSGEMSTGLAFILLWLLHFIGVAVVQDSFNDVLDRPQAAPSGTQPMASAAPPPAVPVGQPQTPVQPVQPTYQSPPPDRPDQPTAAPSAEQSSPPTEDNNDQSPAPPSAPAQS